MHTAAYLNGMDLNLQSYYVILSLWSIASCYDARLINCIELLSFRTIVSELPAKQHWTSCLKGYLTNIASQGDNMHGQLCAESGDTSVVYGTLRLGYISRERWSRLRDWTFIYYIQENVFQEGIRGLGHDGKGPIYSQLFDWSHGYCCYFLKFWLI